MMPENGEIVHVQGLEGLTWLKRSAYPKQLTNSMQSPLKCNNLLEGVGSKATRICTEQGGEERKEGEGKWQGGGGAAAFPDLN